MVEQPAAALAEEQDVAGFEGDGEPATARLRPADRLARGQRGEFLRRAVVPDELVRRVAQATLADDLAGTVSFSWRARVTYSGNSNIGASRFYLQQRIPLLPCCCIMRPTRRGVARAELRPWGGGNDLHGSGRGLGIAAARGGTGSLGLPGRRRPAAVRRPGRVPADSPRAGAPRTGGRPRRRRLRPRPAAKWACVSPTSGPGRHQSGHGHRHGAPRLGANGGHHRPGFLSVIGTDAFQEVNITGITLPITKHNYLVRRVEDVPRTFREAFFLASTGRPGPVLIDLPKDVLFAPCEFEYPERATRPGYRAGDPRPPAPAGPRRHPDRTRRSGR